MGISITRETVSSYRPVSRHLLSTRLREKYTEEVRQVVVRVRELHYQATLKGLLSARTGRGEHVGEDGRLRCEEATIDAEGHALGRSDDGSAVSVIEPKLGSLLKGGLGGGR